MLDVKYKFCNGSKPLLKRIKQAQVTKIKTDKSDYIKI